jgi:hypothetical protein
LLAAFFECGGEKLVEGAHTVELEKLIGVVQTNTQSKVRLNCSRLREGGRGRKKREMSVSTANK